MIIYFNYMRIKDITKQKALFNATITVVNQIGFASSSISKIAKQAGISPATIYIYNKNKEDLLVSTYLQIKKDIAFAIHQDFDNTRPVRDIFMQVWFNLFNYIRQHPAHFQYTEQFANSPFQDLVDKEQIEQYFVPIMDVMRGGIEQKIIKDVHFDILKAFIFIPVLSLANTKICSNFSPTRENIETAFSLAWDAVKR